MTPRTKRIVFRATVEFHRRLQYASIELQRPMVDIITTAVEEYLDRQKGKINSPPPM